MGKSLLPGALAPVSNSLYFRQLSRSTVALDTQVTHGFPDRKRVVVGDVHRLWTVILLLRNVPAVRLFDILGRLMDCRGRAASQRHCAEDEVDECDDAQIEAYHGRQPERHIHEPELRFGDGQQLWQGEYSSVSFSVPSV